MIKNLLVTGIPEEGLYKLLVELKDHSWSREARETFEAHNATMIYYDKKADVYVWSKKNTIPTDSSLVHKNYNHIVKHP